MSCNLIDSIPDYKQQVAWFKIIQLIDYLIPCNLVYLNSALIVIRISLEYECGLDVCCKDHW